MKKVKRWRYYCDHCRKSGASGGWMTRHEAHCLRNPARVCGFCSFVCADGNRAIESDQKPIEVLIAALDDGDKEGVSALREVALGCPACMLAAIVQSGLQKSGEDGINVEFDFKAEKAAFWETHNTESDFREESGAVGHDYGAEWRGGGA